MDSKQEMMLESQAAQEAMERVVTGTDATVDPFQAIADKRAKKILKKNKREIDRLKAHAEKCLYEMNKEGYKYAIGKIRTIIRKPLSDELLEVLYNTSLERIIEIAQSELNKQIQRNEVA
ncbi:MAG: DUF2654 domain-containing protein [Cetobacterium sp.]|uniref:DUF2654 domain-containing protein n=1 Tax=Cetobacterium sp. TaxID=2071632 RepID=UPI003EE501B6